MIALVPHSNGLASLQEFNGCHGAGDGKFCSAPDGGSGGGPPLTGWEAHQANETRQFLAKRSYDRLDTGTLHDGTAYEIYGTRDGSFTVLRARDMSELGRAYVAGDGKDPARNYLTSVHIEPPYQRQGIGTKLYAAIEQRLGFALRPSPNNVSPAAQALWKKRGQSTELLQASLRQFSTGTPVTFEFMRHTEKAPRPGPDDTFAQKIEPAGRYMLAREGSPATGLQTGTVTFRNPLVIAAGGGYSEPSNWKRRLSTAYGGKTGLRLSRAILKAGHDGIVTIASSRVQPDYVSEIVDLTVVKPRTPRG